MRGGYQVIDLKSVNHTVGVGMVHEGIYDLIEGTRKPILLSNIVIDGKEYHDGFVYVDVNESKFLMHLMVAGTVGYQFAVQDTDVVTVTEV